MIESYKLGPGILELDDGTAFDATAQVTKAAIEWDESVQSTDDIPTLSGESLPGEDTVTYSAKLTGEVVQDAHAAGLVAWTWAHRGQTVTFTYTPSSSAGASVSGTVRIVPLTFGGDVGKRNTAPISWACPTEPDLTPGA